MATPPEVHSLSLVDLLLLGVVSPDVKLTLLSAVDGNVDVVANFKATLLQDTDVCAVTGAGLVSLARKKRDPCLLKSFLVRNC